MQRGGGWLPRNGSIIEQIWSNQQLLIEIGQIGPMAGIDLKCRVLFLADHVSEFVFHTGSSEKAVTFSEHKWVFVCAVR